MKLVAIECKCGHIQYTDFPKDPFPDMLHLCEVCRSRAKGVWQNEIQTVTWMSKKEEAG